MTRKKNRTRRPSRIDRLERKCDLILSELIILRQAISRKRDIDSLIDKLHSSAKRMKHQCDIERDAIKLTLNANKEGL